MRETGQGKTDWIFEYARELPPKRPVSECIQDFRDIPLPFSKEKAGQQAARCMDCGLPFVTPDVPLGT